MESSQPTLSTLPTELKLRILCLLDIKTLTHTVRLINHEFRKLSEDYSLYKRYASPNSNILPMDIVQTRKELGLELFKKNLRVLITKTDIYDSIKHLSFPFLEILVITVARNENVVHGDIMYSHHVKVELQGFVNYDSIDQKVIPKLSFVENLIIRDFASVQWKDIKQIPAGTCLLSPNDHEWFDFGSIYRHLTVQRENTPTLEDINTLLREREDDFPTTCNIRTVMSGNMATLQDVLSPRFSDMIRHNLFSFTWQSTSLSDFDTQVVLRICQESINLHEMTLYVNMMPKSIILGCTKLQKLSLFYSPNPQEPDRPILPPVSYVDLLSLSASRTGSFSSRMAEAREQEKIPLPPPREYILQERCEVLFNTVKTSLLLSNLKIQRSIGLGFQLRHLCIHRSSIPHQFLVDLPNCVKLLELRNVIIIDASDSRRIDGYVDVKITGCDAFCVLAHTLDAVGSNVKNLSIDVKGSYIAEGNTLELSQLLTYRSRNLDLFINCKWEDVNDLLRNLGCLRSQLRYLNIDISSMRTKYERRLSSDTLNLLYRLKNLQCLCLIGTVRVELDEVKKIFPSAVINRTRSTKRRAFQAVRDVTELVL